MSSQYAEVSGGLKIIVVCVMFWGTDSALRRDEMNQTLDWWQKTVVYQIYPRSFQDSDGDGVGDLKGIESRLDYIKSLGTDTIWLSPIFKSPMKDFGYDISDFRGIDPIFGTMDDFDSLMTAVKAKGMQLILDYVPNHSSDEHPWFIKSRNREDPYTDYYMWMNGTGPNHTDPPNNWVEVFGGSAWQYDDVRGQFYLHQFVKEQPDLNYRNPLVHQEVVDNWKFWLEKGVHGFRVDAIIHMYEDERMLDEPRTMAPNATPFDWSYLNHVYTTCLEEILGDLHDWRQTMQSYTDKDGFHRLMMTEGYCSPQQAMTYYGNETVPLADFPFNFELQKINIEETALDIYQHIENWLSLVPPYAWPNILVGNHDQRRVATRMGPDNADGMNMLILLLGGTPVVYNGEEIGMEDNLDITYEQNVDPFGCNYGRERYLEKTRDPERAPMQWDDSPGAGFTAQNATPWLPINKNYHKLNVKIQENDKKSHLNFFRSLAKLRQEDSFLYGSLDFPLVTKQVLSFLRVKRGSAGYAVVINMYNQTAQVDLKSTDCCPGFSLPESGDIILTNRGDTRKMKLSEVSLQPNEAMVIRFKPEE